MTADHAAALGTAPHATHTGTRLTSNPPILREWLQYAAVALSLLLFLAFLPRISQGQLGTLVELGFYGVWTTTWLMLASLAVRTVSVRQVVAAWLSGFFAVVLIAYVLSTPGDALFGTSSQFVRGLWVPLVEESSKAIPLVVFALVGRRGRTTTSIMDFVILGFVVGAAFGFHEDALKARDIASGISGDLYGLTFPTFLRTGSQFAVAHAGWTTVVGLGVGVAVTYRRNPLAWLAVPAAIAFVTMDHGSVNYTGWGEGVLAAVMSDGRNAARLLVVGIAVALVHDHLVAAWAWQRDHETPSAAPWRPLLEHPWSTAVLWTTLRRMQYLRARVALHNELWRIRADDEADRTPEVERLDAFARAAGLPRVLPGG